MNEDQDQRPMELEEYIDSKRDQLPGGIGQRLDALLWKEAHPLREFWRQQVFRFRMWWR